MSAPLGVYVHWPYCARICPYCDFNVYKNRAVDEGRWRAALTRDLQWWASRTTGRRLTSLYFGGGTPSLAPLPVIEAVVGACDVFWGFEDGAEITIEANPTDAERTRFRAFASLGINRLSLGAQSFDDAALRFLGRDHDGAAGRRAVETAQAVFGRFSFDLIYALPGDTAAGWRRALREALLLGPPHLSLYQLTIEPQTAFAGAVARGKWAPPADDAAAELYDVAQEETARAGLAAYEVSNHAAPGGESRHNLIYWTGGDYAGVGPGAHGRLTEPGARLATETPLRPEDYLGTVERAGAGASLVERLDAAAARMEKLSMGLRVSGGVALDADDIAALGGRIDALARDGLLVRDGSRLAATPDGRRLLNHVLQRLFV